MFALGFREALEAAVVVMVIATILRRTGYQRRLLSAVAAAAAGSVAVVLVVRSSGAWVGDSGRHVVKLLVSIGAVAVLTSTARWIYEYRRSGAPVPMTPSGAGALVATASFAIVREGFEIALLPAASADNQWAAGSSALVLGVLAGTAVGIVGYMAAAGSVERTTTWAPPVLLVMAAGLTTGVARSSHVVFGIDSGALFEVRSLAALPGWLAELVRGLFGWHSQPRALEVVAYCCYAAGAGTLIARSTARSPMPAAPRTRSDL